MDSNKDKKTKQQQLDSQRRCDAINFGAAHAKLLVSTRDESTEAFQEANFPVFRSAALLEYQSVERVAKRTQRFTRWRAERRRSCERELVSRRGHRRLQDLKKVCLSIDPDLRSSHVQASN